MSPETLMRRHAALLAFGRRASAQPPIQVLMQDAITVIIEVLDTDLGGIGEVVDEGKRLSMRVVAAESSGKSADPLPQNLSLEPGTSMAGFALNMACPVVSADLTAEHRFTDLFLRRLGVASALCVPLNLGSAMFGALGVYARTPREFSSDDVHFVETIAHLLTAAVSRASAEARLTRERTFTEALLDVADTLVLTLDSHGGIQAINRACERITGFSLAQVHGKPLWQTLIAPEEADLVQGIFQTCRGGVKPCGFESSLLTRDGRRRQAAWSVRMISAETGDSSLLMAGIDRTEYVELQEELQKSKALAEKATRALLELKTRLGDAQPTAPQTTSEPPAPSGRDLRTSPRREFHYYQLIAPMLGERIPLRKEFFPVECHDISASGVSFLLDHRPDFESLVVILGRPPSESYFTARVVRVAREDRGEKRFIVGCRFTGRVTL